MTKKEQVDDIVEMLDHFVLQGGGHMNIKVNKETVEQKQVTTTISVDCDQQKSACSLPTMSLEND